VTKSSVVADLGDRLAATPKHQASIWGDYVVQNGALTGLGFGGGIRYVGDTYDVANTVKIPSYTLVDATLSYDLAKLSPRLDGARLSVVAKNLFDTYYVSQCGNVPGCTLGTRRTVLATFNYRW
jgi:iron complex outermembrane receptor protein